MKCKNEFEKGWYMISPQEHRSLSFFTVTLKDELFIFSSIDFLRLPVRSGVFIVNFFSSVSILTLNKKMLALILLNQLEDDRRVAWE